MSDRYITTASTSGIDAGPLYPRIPKPSRVVRCGVCGARAYATSASTLCPRWHCTRCGALEGG